MTASPSLAVNLPVAPLGLGAFSYDAARFPPCRYI